jgi:hypothetical protein
MAEERQKRLREIGESTGSPLRTWIAGELTFGLVSVAIPLAQGVSGGSF